MKTLKKTLCLVLAVVMIFGLLAVSASAALTYKDSADVNYKEAVEVMSKIGVLKGFEDNTFLPTQNVTREQAAKIIAYLMIGNSAQADALTTTSDPFSDVAASRWSAGYVAYCVQKGIINGFEDGTFRPTETVTGLQFAKMLLCALGYGVNNEYVGSAWSINTAKDALNLGIFTGNLKGATNTAATREECALYAYNTLWLNKVSYSALYGDYIALTAGQNAAQGNKNKTIADDFGLTRTLNNVEDDGLYNVYKVNGKQIVKYAVEATYTFTAKTNDKAILKAMGLSKATATTEWYVDCELIDTDDQTADVEAPTLAWDATANNLDTGNGILTRIFAVYNATSGDTEYYVYTTNYYFAQITTAPKADSDGIYRATVTVYTSLGNTAKLTNVNVGEDHAKFDYIVLNFDMTAMPNTTASATAAEADDFVLGMYTPKSDAAQTVTRFDNSDKTVTYGGTAYSYDANFATELNTNYVVGNQYDFYYDTYGYVIGNKTSVDNGALNYVYVTKVDTSAADSTLLHPDAAAVAQVYFLDGSVKTVKLALTTATTSLVAKGYTDQGDDALVKGTVYVKVGTATTPEFYTLASIMNDEKNDSYIATQLYSYTTNADGEYTLSRVLSKMVNGSEQGAVLAEDALSTTKGSAYVTMNGANVENIAGTTPVYAVKSTAMAVVNDGTVTTNTGYQNFPTKDWTDANTVAVYAYTGKVISNILFIGDISAATKVVYGVYTGTYYNDNTGATSVRYDNFKVNGETAAYQVSDPDVLIKGHAYELVIDDTTATPTDIKAADQTLSNKTSSVVGVVDEIHTGNQGYILMDGTAYYFTDSTTCFGAIMNGTTLSYSTDYDVAVGDLVTIVYSTASTTAFNMVTVFDYGEAVD